MNKRCNYFSNRANWSKKGKLGPQDQSGPFQANPARANRQGGIEKNRLMENLYYFFKTSPETARFCSPLFYVRFGNFSRRCSTLTYVQDS